MSFKSVYIAVFAALTMAGMALAGEIIVFKDAYARSSTSKSISGAAFLTIINRGSEDDRLISVTSDIAKRVELHSNKEGEDGVMRMKRIEGGIPIPAGGEHVLARGGDHVMLMGLKRGLEQGAKFTLTLEFEKAGEMRLEVPVDLTR